MLVDDHTMVRQGLATFLKVYDDLQLVSEAADVKTAVQLCEGIVPDVILMDIALPVMDGLTAIRAIRKQNPQVQILAPNEFQGGGSSLKKHWKPAQ